MATKNITPEEFVEALQSWSVLDVVNAVKLMEEKLGIKAAAPVAMAAPSSAAAVEEAVPEEQTEFAVFLTAVGDGKINVYKVVREITGLGIRESKELVDAMSAPIREGLPREEADQVKAKLEEAGASAEVR
jgi:large subunit ribosomal protein L7/L12